MTREEKLYLRYEIIDLVYCFLKGLITVNEIGLLSLLCLCLVDECEPKQHVRTLRK